MGSKPDQRDELNLDDDLGKMIHRSLESRVARMAPPPRGREQLLAAARKQPANHQRKPRSAADDYRWLPPQRREQGNPEHDALSALIHARDSVRRMSL